MLTVSLTLTNLRHRVTTRIPTNITKSMNLLTFTKSSMIHTISYFPGSQSIDSWTSNNELKSWIKTQVDILKPANVYLCTGSRSENENNINCLVASGSLIRLNPHLRPGSYAARSVPSDVARVEARTFICTELKEDAGGDKG